MKPHVTTRDCEEAGLIGDDKADMRRVVVRTINSLVSRGVPTKEAMNYVGDIISAVRDNYGD